MHFDGEIHAATVGPETIQLLDTNGKPLAYYFEIAAGKREVRISPANPASEVTVITGQKRYRLIR